MGNTFYFEWEVGLMQWIQSWLGPVGTAIASVFSLITPFNTSPIHAVAIKR